MVRVTLFAGALNFILTEFDCFKLYHWHKSTLAVPKKISMLSGTTCNCNLTKPNLTLPYLLKLRICFILHVIIFSMFPHTHKSIHYSLGLF